MTTDTPPKVLPRTIDLSDLPEEVVEQVHGLVNEARNGHCGPATPPTPHYVHIPPPLTDEEFRTILDEMASMSSGQSLPLDWSRADLYEDHD